MHHLMNRSGGPSAGTDCLDGCTVICQYIAFGKQPALIFKGRLFIGLNPFPAQRQIQWRSYFRPLVFFRISTFRFWPDKNQFRKSAGGEHQCLGRQDCPFIGIGFNIFHLLEPIRLSDQAVYGCTVNHIHAGQTTFLHLIIRNRTVFPAFTEQNGNGCSSQFLAHCGCIKRQLAPAGNHNIGLDR